MATVPSLKTVLTNFLDPKAGDDVDLGPYESKALTVKDAKDLGKVLATIDFPTWAIQLEPETLAAKLHTITAFFQQVERAAVGHAMLDHVMSHMFRLYDHYCEYPKVDESTAMFMVKIFAMTRTFDGTVRVIEAIPRWPDAYLWSMTFRNYESDHSYTGDLLTALAGTLPTQFSAVAFLDLCNSLARSKQIEQHPFDSAEGRKRLKAWLQSTNPDEFSYAFSATAALPFLSTRGRPELFERAMAHPDMNVRMEAAWGMAHSGDQAGVRYLLRQCMDVNYTLLAQEYLNELELGERIPEAVYSVDFYATAQMSRWLQHPSEFGRVPDRLDMFDKRTLYWPPTKDTRTVWLFKYTYGTGKKADVGIGMVGSITFALFGETNATMAPEDIYALHCCWELEAEDDPRAPKKRSIAAGRKLLGLGRKRS